MHCRPPLPLQIAYPRGVLVFASERMAMLLIYKSAEMFSWFVAVCSTMYALTALCDEMESPVLNEIFSEIISFIL